MRKKLKKKEKRNQSRCSLFKCIFSPSEKCKKEGCVQKTKGQNSPPTKGQNSPHPTPPIQKILVFLKVKKKFKFFMWVVVCVIEMLYNLLQQNWIK